MSDVRADQIGSVLDAIVGSTGINGDSSLDYESMRNIERLGAVCDWLCERIRRSYRGDYPSQCASAESVAKAIRLASCDITCCMGIDVVGLRGIADAMDRDADVLGGGYSVASDVLRSRAAEIREALGVQDA